MTFLMGLKESSAPIRSKLLLMEPEPMTNRVFSLVDQRAIKNSSTCYYLSNKFRCRFTCEEHF